MTDDAKALPDLIERLRALEVDHEPDGWPPVQMRDITALMATIDCQSAELQQATSYAHGLAVALHAKHYAEVSQWEPLPDLLGLLTQIDNMAAGLTKVSAELRRLREALRKDREFVEWAHGIFVGLAKAEARKQLAAIDAALAQREEGGV